MPSGWDHDKVILALAKRGEKVSNLEIVDVYVQTYSQNPNCACIYTASSPFTKNGEWHLLVRPSAKSFDSAKIDVNADYLEKVGVYKDSDKYKVKDWNKFAEKLGLSFGAKESE